MSVAVTPTSVFTDEAQDNWATYRVTIEFTGRLIGGAPSDPQLVEGWMARNLGIKEPEQLQRWTQKHLAEVQGINPAEATMDEIEKALAEGAIEKKAQVFKRTPDGQPYIEGRQIKAGIKEWTNIAFPYPTKWGQKRNTKDNLVGGKTPVDFVAERVWVPEQPIIVAEDTDGIDLAVGHPRDPRTGQKRANLTYHEYVIQPEISLEIQVLDDCIEQEQWARIWVTGERNGIGARRSQGAGQFVVTEWRKSD